MSYTSPLGNLPVIDDNTAHIFMGDVAVNGQPMGRGLIPRDYSVHPEGGLGFAEPFNLPLIPRSEWTERIKDSEANKTRIPDLCDFAGLKVKNQEQTNFCFPPGTLIRMGDGSNKRIEDVKVLDEVLTAEGNIKRVVQTMVNRVSEPLYRLLTWGHSHLKATSGHPILTQRGYVPIADIKIGDKVAFPKYAAKRESFIQTGDFLYERNRAPQSRKKYREYSKPQQEKRFSRGIPGKSFVSVHKVAVPDVIHLTAGFGRLVGLYLAEGHTAPSTVCWSFNVCEKDTLAAETEKLIRDELGCDAYVRIYKSICQVSLPGRKWAELFDALCSRGSDQKRMHPFLAGGPQVFQEEMLRGWMDGDRQFGNSAVSVSRELALNMFDIANSHSFMPLLSIHTKAGTRKDGITRKDSWKVGWGDKGKPNHGTEQDERYLWRKVRGLEQVEYDGWVHNLEVEEDHSYVAEGIGVHNCWVNAPTHCLEIVRCIQGQPFVELSPASVGAKITNFQNVGGWGTQAVQYLVEHGAVPAKLWPDNAISKKYDTPEANAERDKYQIDEWIELKPRNVEQMATCLFLGIPVAIGLNFWSHQVTAVAMVKLDGKDQYGVLFDNSWGTSWGQNGRGVLSGSKMIPDDAIAPRVATAS